MNVCSCCNELVAPFGSRRESCQMCHLPHEFAADGATRSVSSRRLIAPFNYPRVTLTSAGRGVWRSQATKLAERANKDNTSPRSFYINKSGSLTPELVACHLISSLVRQQLPGRFHSFKKVAWPNGRANWQTGGQARKSVASK